MRTASRGKQIRAALMDQQRVHHVASGGSNQFQQLEDELCTWTPTSGWSPNRLDAYVWSLSELIIGGSVGVWVL